MKRKSWQPGGGANAHGELRGRDQWEQISWEEAIDYIAQEAERIYGEFGPAAVIGTKALAVGKILHQLGGHISLSDTNLCEYPPGTGLKPCVEIERGSSVSASMTAGVSASHGKTGTHMMSK